MIRTSSNSWRPSNQAISWLDNETQRLVRHLQLWRGRIARWRGVQAGQRFGLGRGVCIIYPRWFKVGDDVTIEDYSYLHCLSRGGVYIGSYTSIARNLWLHCGCTLEDYDHGFFSIGEYSFIGCNAVIGASGGIRIGDHVAIGPNVTIASENHRFDNPNLRIDQQGVERKGVMISNDCWIGSNVTILDGVTVGESSILAAGAVITKNIPPFSIAAGVPARIIRDRRRQEKMEQSIIESPEVEISL